MGHQISATPPVNSATVLAYTSASYGLGGAGRLSSSTDWLGGTAIRETDYTYDLVGRQTVTSVAPKPSGTSLTTTLTLDSMGRQTSVAATGTTIDTLAETYDAVGRLTSISRSGSALTTFTYNPDGTAATRTDYDANGASYVNSFTYTTLGQLADASLPGGSGTGCSGAYSGHACYTWGLDGNMATRTWGSANISGTYGYDGAKRPVSLSIGRTGQSSNDTIGRTYDLDGNVLSETQTLNLTGGSGSPNPSLAYSGVESYTYDAANRVIASTFDGSIPDARSYTYDADGNRKVVTENGVTFYYSYDAND